MLCCWPWSLLLNLFYYLNNVCGVLIDEALSYKKNHHSSKYVWDLAKELKVSYSSCLETMYKRVQMELRGGTSGRLWYFQLFPRNIAEGGHTDHWHKSCAARLVGHFNKRPRAAYMITWLLLNHCYLWFNLPQYERKSVCINALKPVPEFQ